MQDLSLNLNGELVSLREPLVMGIVNVTPDSFFEASRKQTDADIDRRIATILDEGGRMVDVGAYSSRPGAAHISPDEEWARLEPALRRLRDTYPNIPVSVDTFRAAIACRAVEEYGVAMVNDISGGEMDAQMFDTIARLHIPYILMHMRGTPQTMQQQTDYTDLTGEVMRSLAKKVEQLQALGVNDIVIDPGFGFSKTMEQNYELMRSLYEFRIFERPLLVGVSRKTMIYKLLGTTADESLNGTTVLNTYALLNGAHILRVHDVRAAVEAVKITNLLKPL